jgi:hypothetical protein
MTRHPSMTAIEVLALDRGEKITELEAKVERLREGLRRIIVLSTDLYATDTLARIAKQTLGVNNA